MQALPVNVKHRRVASEDPLEDDDLSDAMPETAFLPSARASSSSSSKRTKKSTKKWVILLLCAILYFTNAYRTVLVVGQFILGSAIPPYHWQGGHAHIMELMKCTAREADALGLDWWLDEGTLLGSIREGDMVKRDSDIDIAFMENQKHLFPVFASRMRDRCGMHVMTREENKGYNSLTSFTIHRVAMRVFSARLAPPWFIDIREYDVDPDGAIYDLDFVQDNDTPYLPLDVFLPLADCKLRGEAMKCPHDSVPVIEDLFGADWRVPMPGFKTWMLQRDNTYVLPSAFVDM